MPRTPYEPLTEADFDQAFPASRKVYVGASDGPAVPMREIALTNGESLRVYDTSGPRGIDVHVGLPAVRQPWIERRRDSDAVRPGTRRPVRRAKAGRAVTQLHYARRGDITPEVGVGQPAPPSMLV
jgi:phosphomethylpyrimidine synthase